MNKKEILRFILGVSAIILMVTYIIPMINTHTDNPVMNYINEHELDTGVLFYTDSDEGLEAIHELSLQ